MLQTILLIVSIGSLAGLIVFVVRKLPDLKRIEAKSKTQKSFVLQAKKRIKEIWLLIPQKTFASDSWSVIIQKLLSKIRILAMKIERRTDLMLSRHREKYRQKKENEDYWRKLSRFSSKMKKKKK